MAVTGEEIRRGLAELAARWGGYDGSETAEAHTFLTELLACYGTQRRDAGVRFEESTRSGGFMDMIWPRACIFEMKRPSESNRLVAHRQQAIGYWRESGTPEVPAPRYVVLCSFHRFEVWEPGAVYTAPRVVERDVLQPVSALGPERLLLPIHQDRRRTSGGGERQPPKGGSDQDSIDARGGIEHAVASQQRQRVSGGGGCNQQVGKVSPHVATRPAGLVRDTRVVGGHALVDRERPEGPLGVAQHGEPRGPLIRRRDEHATMKPA